MGLKLSLDDFGAGYSSLDCPRKLPLDEIKIDHSFIKEVSDRSDCRAIVSASVVLARSLKLSTVPEGNGKKQNWSSCEN